MPLIELVVRKEGQVIDTITMAEKTFKSGSKGYFAQKKLDIDGDGVKHQGQFQLVKIHSAEKEK